jgi:hypothetical protein
MSVVTSLMHPSIVAIVAATSPDVRQAPPPLDSAFANAFSSLVTHLDASFTAPVFTALEVTAARHLA